MRKRRHKAICKVFDVKHTFILIGWLYIGKAFHWELRLIGTIHPKIYNCVPFTFSAINLSGLAFSFWSRKHQKYIKEM